MKNTPFIYARLLLIFWLPVSGSIAANEHGVAEANLRRYRELQVALEQNKPGEIASFFSLPYRLPYPVPPIRTADDFADRIDEVLDDTVRTRLLEANPNDDLARVGLRGIMLEQGIVWFQEEDMRIFAVNHQTQTLSEKRDRLIAEMKARLHPSVRVFDTPIMEKETRTRRFRVDKLEDGSYRYAVWPLEKSFEDEPSLVVGGVP